MGKKNHRILNCVCGKPNPVIHRQWSYYAYNCTGCGVSISGPDIGDLKAKLSSVKRNARR